MIPFTLTGDHATLEVDRSSDETRLAVTVVGTGQVPTAYVDFDSVIRLRDELSAWITATRPKVPLRRDDLYDGRPMNDGTILRPNGPGLSSWTRANGEWRVPGSATVVKDDVLSHGNAIVAYVPGQVS